jgi:hypothetical protein
MKRKWRGTYPAHLILLDLIILIILGEDQEDFFFHWLYSPLGPWPLIFSFVIILQTIGPLGRVISSSQGLYLNTGQHKQNKHIHIPNINALCGIRTHDPGFRASEDSICLRRRGYSDRPQEDIGRQIRKKQDSKLRTVMYLQVKLSGFHQKPQCLTPTKVIHMKGTNLRLLNDTAATGYVDYKETWRYK